MIIEFVGPAGAGKSTLSKALSERIDNARLETKPSYRKAENIPYFARNTLSTLPILPQIFLRINGKYPLWEHIVFTVTLNGWHEVLNKKNHKGVSVLILDQGPVYMIAYETLFGFPRFESNAFKKYLDRAFHCWAETLDLVIWLDTSLPVLLERIHQREKQHSVKDLGDVDAYQYLESYRKVYDNVVSRLKACSSKLRVLRIDTGQYSPEKAVEKVIYELYPKDR